MKKITSLDYDIILYSSLEGTKLFTIIKGTGKARNYIDNGLTGCPHAETAMYIPDCTDTSGRIELTEKQMKEFIRNGFRYNANQ